MHTQKGLREGVESKRDGKTTWSCRNNKLCQISPSGGVCPDRLVSELGKREGEYPTYIIFINLYRKYGTGQKLSVSSEKENFIEPGAEQLGYAGE